MNFLLHWKGKTLPESRNTTLFFICKEKKFLLNNSFKISRSCNYLLRSYKVLF